MPGNERLRWINNDKFPSRVELRDLFHASETEENRMEMLGYYMSVFHLLRDRHPDSPVQQVPSNEVSFQGQCDDD